MTASLNGQIPFRATIEVAGKTATGVEVPPEVVAALGSGKRPAVRATINGHTYRTSVASIRGRFMLPISAIVREQASVAAGDEIGVALELDTAPRVVTVPSDFAEALDGVPKARRFFDDLSYSNKQRFVVSIEGAKSDETRRRRIAKAVTLLSEERAT